MLNWVLRGVLILWAAFFGLMGARGFLNPDYWVSMFGVFGDSTGTNTLRADLAAFFLVSAGGALYGALVPGALRALWVPAALFGTAFVGRIYGLTMGGDALTAQISQALLIEAISTTIMLVCWWHLSRPPAAAMVASTPATTVPAVTAPAAAATAATAATEGDLP
ncbi:MAG: hypothetical protein RLZZ58_1624 [Pseudomonadota bacterium]|jgi:hypothetical protein